jgi:hypothetical protein
MSMYAKLVKFSIYAKITQRERSRLTFHWFIGSLYQEIVYG